MKFTDWIYQQLVINKWKPDECTFNYIHTTAIVNKRFTKVYFILRTGIREIRLNFSVDSRTQIFSCKKRYLDS